MPVNDVGAALLPYGELHLRHFRARVMSYAYNPNFVSARNSRLMGQRTELGCIIPYSLYTPCVVYVIYAVDLPQLGVYVGLTYGSTMERVVEHIHAARAYLRRPRAGRSIYQRSFRLYDMFAYYGLHSFAWMAFQQLGKPEDYVDAKEFNQIHAPAEGSVLDRLQALHPHGFNIRNTVEAARRRGNADRNIRRGRHKQDRASMQLGPQDTAFGPPVSHPPWTRSAQPSASNQPNIHMPAAFRIPASHAGAAPPNPPPPPQLQPRPPGSSMLDDMAGNPDAFSSYARTAHSLLTASWRYSTDREFTDLDTTPTLSPHHPVIVHLLTMNKSTVCKVLHVLEQYSISHLQRLCSRSSFSAQVFVWSYDRLLFVRCCLKKH